MDRRLLYFVMFITSGCASQAEREDAKARAQVQEDIRACELRHGAKWGGDGKKAWNTLAEAEKAIADQRNLERCLRETAEIRVLARQMANKSKPESATLPTPAPTINCYTYGNWTQCR